MAQRLVEIRAAEIGEVVLVAAAEGNAVRPCRGDDQRRVGLQRLDEAAGIARRDHDDAPFDLRLVEHLAQALGAQVVEMQRREIDRQHAARAVRCEVEEQHVLVGVHARGNLVERRQQVVRAGQGLASGRRPVVHEIERAAARVEAVVEELADAADLAQEHVLLRVAGEADEIEIGDARPLGGERPRRLRDQAVLRVIDLLDVDAVFLARRRDRHLGNELRRPAAVVGPRAAARARRHHQDDAGDVTKARPGRQTAAWVPVRLEHESIYEIADRKSVNLLTNAITGAKT